MNKKRIVKILGILLFVTLSFVLLSKPITPTAYAASCPSYMDPNSLQCLNYLKDQLEKIQSQQSTLQKQLNNEAYQQLTLQEKITYMTNQISQTERVIKSLEVEIAANDIEIKLLSKDIQDKEDYISILRQETNILEQTVNQRITESYKYSFVGPLEIFLDVKSLSSALRRTKYLIATRSQDIVSLEEYASKIENLKQQETDLATKKANLQIKRNSVEQEKLSLAKEVNTLANQKDEKNRLLAESKAKEAELLAALRKNKDLQKQLDTQILAYINAHLSDIINSGPVYKGNPIGYVYPSSSKCSTGPHLHFGIDSKSSGTFSASVNPFSTYLIWGAASGLPLAPDKWNYPYVLSNRYSVPIGGSVIMTQDYHSGYAIDLSKPGGSANAPVLAADDGTLWKGVDSCGQKYAIIVHNKPNSYKYGYRTIYVHLK